MTASGGLVVAILADRDEESLRQVGRCASPAAAAADVIVLDARRWSGGHGHPRPARRAVGASASAFADLLHTAGWSVAVAAQGDRIPEVWSALTTRGALVG